MTKKGIDDERRIKKLLHGLGLGLGLGLGFMHIDASCSQPSFCNSYDVCTAQKRAGASDTIS